MFLLLLFGELRGIIDFLLAYFLFACVFVYLRFVLFYVFVWGGGHFCLFLSVSVSVSVPVCLCLC